MKRGLLKSSRFSPGNMQPEALEALFVGRTNILSDVLKKIKQSVLKAEKHYVLLLGPRGSGKTHFVALVNHRLRADNDAETIADNAFIAYLNEEEWGVASYLNFLLRIIETLSVTYQSSGLADKIAGIRASFQISEVKAITLAQRILIDYVGEKTLIVLCENLNDLFEGLGSEGQKRWRAFMQEHSFWTVLATSPALFDAVALQDNPFYGFFTFRRLDRLTFDSALELLTKKAKFENQLELVEFLRTPIGRARVRAIHHMAGGNHRVYVVLFEFLTKQSLDDIVGPFMKMVDDLTPYYQDRIRLLPPAQRKIIEYLCYKHAPITVKQIANDCLFSPQTTAKQLGELKNLGYVLRNKSGKNSLYELTEPLMRICVEVKDNRTEYLTLFVDFLRHWFTHREILERAENIHEGDLKEHVIDSMHLEAAISEYKEDHREPIYDGFSDELFTCLRHGEYDKAEPIAARLATDRGSEIDFLCLIESLREQEKYSDAVRIAEQCLQKYPRSAKVYAELGNTYYSQRDYKNALSSCDKAIEIDPENVSYRCSRGRTLLQLDRYEEAVENERELLKLDSEHWHSYLQLAYAYQGLEKYDKAEEYARKVIALQPKEAQPRGALARILSDQQRHEEALASAELAVTLEPNTIGPLYDLAWIHIAADKPELAINPLEKALKLEPNRIGLLCISADAYLEAKQFKMAVERGKQLLTIDPEHWHAYQTVAQAQLSLGLVKEAVETYDNLAENINSEITEYLKYGMGVMFQRGLLDVAARYSDKLLLIDENDKTAWLMKGRVSAVRGDFENAIEIARNIEQRLGNTIAGELITIEARLNSEQFDLGLASLTKLLERNLSDEDRDNVTTFVAEMAIEQQNITGVTGATRILTAAKDTLTRMGRTSWQSAILISFVRDLIPIKKQLISSWSNELEILNQLFKDDISSDIPLAMLKAAIAYQVTGDQASLLTLPIEQRSLLEEGFGLPTE